MNLIRKSNISLTRDLKIKNSIRQNQDIRKVSIQKGRTYQKTSNQSFISQARAHQPTSKCELHQTNSIKCKSKKFSIKLKFSVQFQIVNLINEARANQPHSNRKFHIQSRLNQPSSNPKFYQSNSRFFTSFKL